MGFIGALVGLIPVDAPHDRPIRRPRSTR